MAASRTLLQKILNSLNLTLDAEDLFYLNKQKKWFLWAMRAVRVAENYGYEAWPNIYNEGYKHQLQPGTTQKIQ